MARIEIHAGEGGADAALFASELADAVGRSFDATVTTVAGVIVVEGPACL